jgi:long-subunit acyl-CoA synthetase (AMP-forming)
LKYFGIVFAMTELLVATSICVRDPREDKSRRNLSVGDALPFHELKVIDLTTDEILPHNQTGQLCVKSFCTTNGYWEDEAKTKEILTSDGWFVGDFYHKF